MSLVLSILANAQLEKYRNNDMSKKEKRKGKTGILTESLEDGVELRRGATLGMVTALQGFREAISRHV